MYTVATRIEAGGQSRLDHRDGNAPPTIQSSCKVLAKARPGRGRHRHTFATDWTSLRFRSRPMNVFLAC